MHICVHALVSVRLASIEVHVRTKERTNERVMEEEKEEEEEWPDGCYISHATSCSQLSSYLGTAGFLLPSMNERMPTDNTQTDKQTHMRTSTYASPYEYTSMLAVRKPAFSCMHNTSLLVYGKQQFLGKRLT